MGQYIPQDGSPLDPLVLGVSGPVTDDGGVFSEGLDTEALGDGFVVALQRAGDWTGGCALDGTKTLEVDMKPDGVASGSGSDLNTPSKRARLK